MPNTRHAYLRKLALDLLSCVFADAVVRARNQSIYIAEMAIHHKRPILKRTRAS